MDILLERRSIRNYTTEHVRNEDIQYILHAGMSAPSAKNTKCYSFIVIKNKETHKKIANILKGAQMILNAPLAILIVGDENKSYEQYLQQDCSAATQNILLAATAKKYGSIWCGIYSNKDREEKIQKLFKLPNNIKPFSIVVIGKDANKPQNKNNWDTKKIYYESWK
jgi:nitroreductase